MAPSLSAKDGLPWIGVLDEDEIKQLQQDFGDVVLCPGLTPEYGRSADDWGRLMVPGATAGYYTVRSKFTSWQKKIVEDEKYNWWPSKAEESGVTLIKISDVLSGIQGEAWQTYRNRYSSIRSSRAAKRSMQNRLEKARKMAAEKDHEQAAIVLSQLSVAWVQFKT